MFSLDSCMSGLYFMHGELTEGLPKFNAGYYVLVIRRKDDGLTDIVSNEARRAEFDTISVRPSSFRRITYVKH